MGSRVERGDFERTLYGGRVVVTGRVVVVSPLTPIRLLWRLGRAVLRASAPPPPPERIRALPDQPGLLGRARDLGRRLLGLGVEQGGRPATSPFPCG